RRRHTRFDCDWSSDVCSSDLLPASGRGLPFHTVYVATAIASGSLVGTWMNDSGFWLFSKMGGVTELETFKSWTPVLAVVGVTSRSEERRVGKECRGQWWASHC